MPGFLVQKKFIPVIHLGTPPPPQTNPTLTVRFTGCWSLIANVLSSS